MFRCESSGRIWDLGWLREYTHMQQRMDFSVLDLQLLVSNLILVVCVASWELLEWQLSQKSGSAAERNSCFSDILWCLCEIRMDRVPTHPNFWSKKANVTECYGWWRSQFLGLWEKGKIICSYLVLFFLMLSYCVLIYSQLQITQLYFVWQYQIWFVYCYLFSIVVITNFTTV